MEASSKRHGAVLKCLDDVLKRLRGVLELSKVMILLHTSFQNQGFKLFASKNLLAASWKALEVSWSHRRASWRRLGAIFGSLGRMFFNDFQCSRGILGDGKSRQIDKKSLREAKRS